MKARNLLLPILLAASLLAGPSEATADGGFVLVVNKGNDATQLSRSELKKLVTGGTKQWKSGAAVQVGIIATEAPETAHLATLIDLAPKELLSRIQEQVFKGEMRRPVVLRSSAECVAFARGNPGAICVASSSTPLAPETHAVALH
jgi:ABC-type phosphate transport system substrate-binding protein